jgi:hypothetical protein
MRARIAGAALILVFLATCAGSVHPRGEAADRNVRASAQTIALSEAVPAGQGKE